jgi:hypothetical protein
MDIEEEKRMGFKDLFKQRIPVYIMSGAQAITKGNGGVQSANILKGDSPGEIFVKVPLGGGDYRFKFTKIEWEESNTRSAGKAAAGAIIGSIAGPVGTIAGAAIGGQKKDTSKAYMYVIDQDENEHCWHIKCDQNLYIQLSGLLG